MIRFLFLLLLHSCHQLRQKLRGLFDLADDCLVGLDGFLLLERPLGDGHHLIQIVLQPGHGRRRLLCSQE